MIIKNEHIIGKAYKGTTPVRKMYGGTSLSFNNGIESFGGGVDDRSILNAKLGDVLMYDKTNERLTSTINGEWNIGKYPESDFEPIAICVVPLSNDGTNKWIGLLDYTAIKWSTERVRIGANSNNNGKANTRMVIDYSEFSSSTYPAFGIVNDYVTSGTSAGDWYLPSIDEYSIIYANKSALNEKLNDISNAIRGKADVFPDRYAYWSSTECSEIQGYRISFVDGRTICDSKDNPLRLRPMILFTFAPTYQWVWCEECSPNCECGDDDVPYNVEKKQVSYDDGNTWTDVSPLETRVSDLNVCEDANPPACGENWVSLSAVTACSQGIRKMKLIGDPSLIKRFNAFYPLSIVPCSYSGTYQWTWDDIEDYYVGMDEYDNPIFEIDFESSIFGSPIYGTSGFFNMRAITQLKNNASKYGVVIEVVLLEE